MNMNEGYVRNAKVCGTRVMTGNFLRRIQSHIAHLPLMGFVNIRAGVNLIVSLCMHTQFPGIIQLSKRVGSEHKRCERGPCAKETHQRDGRAEHMRVAFAW